MQKGLRGVHGLHHLMNFPFSFPVSEKRNLMKTFVPFEARSGPVLVVLVQTSWFWSRPRGSGPDLVVLVQTSWFWSRPRRSGPDLVVLVQTSSLWSRPRGSGPDLVVQVQTSWFWSRPRRSASAPFLFLSL
ncbi:uncharacterized protein V6R79_009741 [Siganus canaliculatus]